MHTVEEIAALLHIHKEAASHGGALNNIQSAAYLRLKQINSEMKPEDLGLRDHTEEQEPALARVQPERNVVGAEVENEEKPTPAPVVFRRDLGATTGEPNPMEINNGK